MQELDTGQAFSDTYFMLVERQTFNQAHTEIPSPEESLRDSTPLSLTAHVPPGRIVEVSGDLSSSRYTTVCAWVAEIHRNHQLVAWVTHADTELYPPDMQRAGIDLESLVVVHPPALKAALRITEMLMQTGAFALVVLEFPPDCQPRKSAWQSRLLSLARTHQSRLVCMTSSSEAEPSLGPLVGVRMSPLHKLEGSGTFTLHPQMLKNKLGSSHAFSPVAVIPPYGLL